MLDDKEQLFEQNHPVIQELRSIPQIVFPEQEEVFRGREGWISLKELFQKKNMDLYHVDCLVLFRIARKMVEIQEALHKRKIYPGLYDLQDIYVSYLKNWEVAILQPERFQILDLEQDYEWYPEDERIYGDLVFFDSVSQKKADQRLLYKILIGSGKGNVKVPPRSNEQDYAELFYGTLPVYCREIFQNDQVLNYLQWKEMLDDMIQSEEYFEQIARDNYEQKPKMESVESISPIATSERKRRCLFVILRTETEQPLEISRLLYEVHDQLEIEQSHGRFSLEQGYLYGDKVIRKKDFKTYDLGYRVQIPGQITAYPIVETLLVGCEWMWEILAENSEEEPRGSEHFLYIITDGKIENNLMFKECLKRLSDLKENGCEILFVAGKDTACEGWNNLKHFLKQLDLKKN